jgi:hypothetical protein
MIVDKVWKLTNTVWVGLDARSSHAQRQSTFPDHVCSYCPPCHSVSHYTGEGGKGKRGRTDSDDAGGKSLSETCKSTCGQSVGESSTGEKSTVILTSVNIFEVSKRDKPQYFVDVVKDKRRTKNNNLEFLIGWRAFPDPKDDTWEPLVHLRFRTHDPGIQAAVGARLREENCRDASSPG